MGLIEDKIKAAARAARHLGADVEIVGRWVWAKFKEKPRPEARITMTENGYRWNRKRSVWQFAAIPCRFSRASTQALREKYQAVPFAGTGALA